MRSPVFLLLLVVTLLAWPVSTAFPDSLAGQWTLRVDLRGRRIEATPLHASENRVLLLGRDGHLWDFPPSQAEDYSKISDSFRSYSQAEMRGQLLREFGKRFDVSGTGHYLVVHPAGQRDRWAERFEDLYRSFVHYFTARGIRPTAPRFPLVAVVFHEHKDFLRYAVKRGARPGPNVLGYYSPTTNRVLLYDVTAGNETGRNWRLNAGTIIHEATHQTAFNTGIHQRTAPTPVWLAEGLATMFEAPGVYDSQRYRQQADRLNRYRLDRFQNYVRTRSQADWLVELIRSDRVFKSDADGAYAQAWALTFFLVETQPRQFSQYLMKTASRPPMKPYTGSLRKADFAEAFGDDWLMLEARLLRFVKRLDK